MFVPVNMEFCTRGMVPEARKDLAQCLTAAKGKASTAALLEVKDLSMGRIEEMAEACIGGGADLVMLSCVTGGSVRLDSVRKLKERGIRVGVYGGTSAGAAGGILPGRSRLGDSRIPLARSPHRDGGE